MIGTPPPAELAGQRPAIIAAWYWLEIQDDECVSGATVGDEDYDPTECETIQDLILGAVEAGVIGHLVAVEGFAEPQPLHSLVAPYRTRPGGLAEQQEATRRAALDRPVPRRYRSVDPA